MKNEKLNEIAKEYVGTGFSKILEWSLDLAPYVGKIIQNRKLNRVERRIKEYAEHLKRIDMLFASEKLSKDYIQEKIGPIVLSDLLEEHEDAKIIYLLQGFENVFINECKNESVVINYFDTLRSLRYEDVRMLFYLSGIAENPFKDYTKGSPEHILSKQIYSKLERLYLIKSASTFSYLELGPEAEEADLKPMLTPYGKNFIKFIAIDFDEAAYEKRIKDYDNTNGDVVPKIKFIEQDLKNPKPAVWG